MSRKTSIAVVTFSALSFVASATTLTIVLVGAKKLIHEVNEAKNKIESIRSATNEKLARAKAVIENLEI